MPIVGPTAANAALEGSKIHSKRFMQKLGIPTARFQTVASAAEATDALAGFRFPLVLKTDGLAAGKGVVIAQNRAEAEAALATLSFPLVIEEPSPPDFILTATGFNADDAELNGSKFLLGNGYVGYRGTLEEYGKDSQVAVTVAGLYDRTGDAWREPVNAPNGFYTVLSAGGEVLSARGAAPAPSQNHTR